MGKLYLLIIAALGLSGKLAAQSFTVADSLPVGAYGTAAWGDFDGDGRKDLVYITQTATAGQPDIFKVYHNTAAGFVPVAQTFTHLFNPAACWGDLDNDGKDDLVVSGMSGNTGSAVTQLFRSNGDGTFSLVNDTLPGLLSGAVDIADYNNDGLRDIAASGMDDLGQPFSYIYKNNGSFSFTDIQAGLEGIYSGEMKWCDYDQDGRADLALNGFGQSSRTYVYHNDGNDSFHLASPYMKGGAGTLDWLDFDGDGRKDLLVTGVDSSGALNFTSLYQNNGDGTFSLQTTTNLPAFGEPAAADVADFNGDGKPDICLSGGNEPFAATMSAMAYGNGSDQFVLEAFRNTDIQNCIVAAADIDNDGDPDLIFGNFILRNEGAGTGIAALQAAQVSWYPNPAGHVLMVSSKIAGMHMVIADISGRTVMRKQLEEGLHAVDVSKLEPGNYMVIMRAKEQSLVKPLVICR